MRALLWIVMSLAPTRAGSPGPVPLVLHRISPSKTDIWTKAMRSWDKLGARIAVYHDEDLVGVVASAFPELAGAVSRMRTTIEKTDISRLALMYSHGGIYADLDQRLLDPDGLRAMLATGLAYLPFEKARLVGQSILISPPGHPIWRHLARAMVTDYDSNCYETLNTGPDKLTELWNALCFDRSDVLAGVTLHRGLIKGPITQHLMTGHRTWKNPSRSASSLLRKAGCFGCVFQKAAVACSSRSSSEWSHVLRHPTAASNKLRLIHAIPVQKPVEVNLSTSNAAAAHLDGAMTMSGVRVGDREYFAARLCDAGCMNGKHVTRSTLILGGMGCSSSECHWTHAQEVYLPFAYSPSLRFFNGPEDARIDVAGGQLFAMANIPAEEVCLGSSWKSQKMRDMAFIPLGSVDEAIVSRSPIRGACRIAVPRTERCRREKNWASLVVNSSIFLVYSLVPFQVVYLDTALCRGQPMPGRSAPGEALVAPERIQHANLELRGSTRYVEGLVVPEGVIFWALAHRQRSCHAAHAGTRCTYDHHVVAVLVSGLDSSSSGARGQFEFLGVSAPILEDALLHAHQASNTSSFTYVHSILAYADNVATVTLHVDDKFNFRAELVGVPGELQRLYETYRNATSSTSKPVPATGPPRDSTFNTCVVNKGVERRRTPRIALVTDFVLADETARYPPWLARATASKACYASLHSYAFVSRVRANYSAEELAFVEPSLKQKTITVRSHLSSGHEWVVWLDYDVLIMNGSVALEELLLQNAEGFDVVVADGGDEVNAGIFAVKNSPGGFAFLNAYEEDAAFAARQKGHLPWRDNGYLMHAALRGIVEDAGIRYQNECLIAGLRRSKNGFRRCFWKFRKALHGLQDADIDGPPRGSRAVAPNTSSGASYRVYLSRDGVINNLLSWKAPNNYLPGDLLLHFAGPDKSAVTDYLGAAMTC